jgi:hypothetical protein
MRDAILLYLLFAGLQTAVVIGYVVEGVVTARAKEQQGGTK